MIPAATLILNQGSDNEVTLTFNTREEYDLYVKSLTSQEELKKDGINSYIDKLQEFTKNFLKEAMNENIALGISLESLETVEKLTTNTSEISNALNLGVLQVAEDKIRTFDISLIDGKYITESRLLEWRNKIRLFRRLQPVTTYNE